jgi:hypothetical protein
MQTYTYLSEARPRLCVDGCESDHEDAPYAGDGEFPPFVVFDIAAQENIALNLPTRNAAERVMSLIHASGVAL